MPVLSKAAFVVLAMVWAHPAAAANIIVSQQPWDWDYAASHNMVDVFGSNFDAIGSFAAADVGAVFVPANRFVYLEGSAYSDFALATYLKTNAAPIASWVSAGGHLLIQSSGEHVPNEITFAGVSLARTPASPNRSGNFTAAGAAAFTAFFVAPHPSGASLAEDVITGQGLTVYMTGDDNGGTIVAGKRYGRGTVLFSALTDSYFQYPGPGGTLGDVNELVDNTIAFAAFGAGSSAVPLPGSAALLGASLLVLAGLGRGSTDRARAGRRADMGTA